MFPDREIHCVEKIVRTEVLAYLTKRGSTKIRGARRKILKRGDVLSNNRVSPKNAAFFA
ncbi:MAG: hypothetical protein ACFFAS_03810 [Promethearchaeota archaeon]